MTFYVEYRNDEGMFYYLHTDRLWDVMTMAYANRVWKEENGTVEFIKNRHGIVPVDMKEFFWIKLKSTRTAEIVLR